MDKHLLEAAERGDPRAQFNLGIMYENGLSNSRYITEGSRPEALRWLRAAAEQGLPRAQVKLAELYAGEGDTPENSIEACAWFLLAAESLQGALLEQAQRGIRPSLLAPDAGANRQRQALRAMLEAGAADSCRVL